MAEYVIYYSGVAYVEADNEDEAESVFWDGGSYSDEYKVDKITEL